MKYYSKLLNKEFNFKEKKGLIFCYNDSSLDSCVYQHIVPNGKKYYGITRQNPAKNRWNNGAGYVKNKKFFADILEYGWNNIEHYILTSYITLIEAFYYEYALIIRDKTYNDDFGYNHEKIDINYFIKNYTQNENDCFLLNEILQQYANVSIAELLKRSDV